jgi:LacI family transcriptional regulator
LIYLLMQLKIITSNESIKMTTPPTLAEIARLAGVGTATVDRVLNKRPGVHAETAERVMQVVAKLGAIRQPGRPRRGENFRFAYVLPDEPSPFFNLIDRQIAQSAGDFRQQHPSSRRA